MNIGALIVSVMTFTGDASQLRSTETEHYHDSKQWHDENAHLMYVGEDHAEDTADEHEDCVEDDWENDTEVWFV